MERKRMHNFFSVYIHYILRCLQTVFCGMLHKIGFLVSLFQRSSFSGGMVPEKKHLSAQLWESNAREKEGEWERMRERTWERKRTGRINPDTTPTRWKGELTSARFELWVKTQNNYHYSIKTRCPYFAPYIWLTRAPRAPPRKSLYGAAQMLLKYILMP